METREFECLQGLMDGFRNHLRLTTTDMDGILMENLRAAILVCEHEISTVIPVSSFTLGTEFSPAISLRYPVLQVTSVKVDGQVVPATEYSFDQKELRFDNFHRVGENCFTCTILYKADFTATQWYGKDSYEREDGYQMVFIRQNDQWLAATMSAFE